MAIKEAQSRNRIHAVYAARETSTSSELVRVVEALNRLKEKVEMKAATNQKEVEQNLELMRKQLAQKQVQLAPASQSFITQPGSFERVAVFVTSKALGEPTHRRTVG
jgi:Zn-dependent M16 (insulinase) family peptidase